MDDAGRPLPPGQVGRLAVKGPTGCRYLDDERQRNYVQDGWNYTGDAYLVDDDGWFVYQARTDDMIVSAGYNIAGPEVEGALLLHPAVAECGVVAAPDDERGADRQGLRRAEGRPRAGRGAGARAAGPREGDRSRRTSIRARSSSSRRCRAPRPASCSASGCGRWPTPTRAGRRHERRRATRAGAGSGLVAVLQPPGWAAPKGYANGIAARGHAGVRRRPDRLERPAAVRGRPISSARRARRWPTSSPCWRRPARGPSTSSA